MKPVSRNNYDNINGNSNSNEPGFKDIEFTLVEESKIAKETTTFLPSFGDPAQNKSIIAKNFDRNNKATRTADAGIRDIPEYMAPESSQQQRWTLKDRKVGQ